MFFLDLVTRHSLASGEVHTHRGYHRCPCRQSTALVATQLVMLYINTRIRCATRNTESALTNPPHFNYKLYTFNQGMLEKDFRISIVVSFQDRTVLKQPQLIMKNLLGTLHRFTVFCKDAFVQGWEQLCPFPTPHSHLCSPTVPQTGISCWPAMCLLPFFRLDRPAVLLRILPRAPVCSCAVR